MQHITQPTTAIHYLWHMAMQGFGLVWLILRPCHSIIIVCIKTPFRYWKKSKIGSGSIIKPEQVMTTTIDWLIDWLIDWCFTARQHKIDQFVPIYQGGLLAQAFKNSQRETYKNIQLHTIQWTYTCNVKQQVCLTCLKKNNAYNKLHDPERVKNASGRATPSLSTVHNYVSAFTTNKLDPTPCTVIYSLGVVAVFRHAQDIVWQVKVLHVANCHDKI